MTDYKTTLMNKDIDFDDHAAFSGSLEDIAKCGIHRITHTPASASEAIFTGTMRMAELNLDSPMQGSGHGIAGFDYLLITGTADSVQQFVHEAKLKMSNTGTTGSVSFYKPAIDSIDGTIVNLKMIDCELDLSGISGAITNKYSVYSPDTDKIMLQKGGLLTHAGVLVDNYILTDNDSGNTFLMFAGAAKTITIPSTLSAGFKCTIIQGDANQITFAASGGNTVFNKDAYTKSEKMHAVCHINIVTSGGGGAGYLSGDTGV